MTIAGSADTLPLEGHTIPAFPARYASVTEGKPRLADQLANSRPPVPLLSGVHELSIVEALIDQVQQEVDRSGHLGRIVRLELIIGRFFNIERIGADMKRLAPEAPIFQAAALTGADVSPIAEWLVARSTRVDSNA